MPNDNLITCRACGALISKDAKYCTNCGEPQKTDRFQVSESVVETDHLQTSSNTSQNIDEYDTSFLHVNSPLSSTPILGMRWYNFVTKVQLWLAFIVVIANGLSQIATTLEGENEALITFPVWKTVNMLYGVSLICVAIVILRTRKKLVRFEKDGPQYYYFVCTALFVLPLLYPFMLCVSANIPIVVMFEGFIANPSTISSAIVSLVNLVLNYIYFEKRKYLFVH